MDILIIGNGFDLAHGLKTSYKDFLECCSKTDFDYYSEGKNGFMQYAKNNLWTKHFITRYTKLGNTWIDLEKEIYNVILKLKELPAITGNGYPQQSFPLIGYLTSDDSFSFYDIEKCLKQASYGEAKNRDNFSVEEEDGLLCIFARDTNSFITLIYKQLREFTSIFEKYLAEKVLLQLENNSKYMLSLSAIGVPEGSKDLRILSFNYTDTCEKLYSQKFNTYCELNIKPIYVHGKVNASEICKLVLGTHSFTNKSSGINALNHNIPLGFNVFKKHNQRHKYGTIEPYQDLLKELTDKNKVVYPVFHIIGHSLDNTDHNILKHILLANENSIINIYYHNEESQERLIDNITDIIGEDNVMSKVRLIYQHDPKRGLLRPKNANDVDYSELLLV